MDSVIIIDFGGQYAHLITRRIRDLGVYSEIFPYDVNLEIIRKKMPKAIILSGGPGSIYEQNSPSLSNKFFQFTIENKIPVLGICYGHHLIIDKHGGKVKPKKKKEYGKTNLFIIKKNLLFDSLGKEEIVWMSHGDQVTFLPKGFKILAKTENCPIASFVEENKFLYGVQFHPEVVNTPKGNKILENFIFKIAQCKREWKVEGLIKTIIEKIKKEIGLKNKVILGLSGGVDSSVAAVLIHRAIGDRLHCVFVNNGLLRKNEEIEIQRTFEDQLSFKNFHYIDAEELFLERLEKVEDPEET